MRENRQSHAACSSTTEEEDALATRPGRLRVSLMGTLAPDGPMELTRKIADLEARVRDLEQRLDTAQTHQWKRAWFWLRWGWPMTNWNADRPNWRPWNRDRRVG